MNNKRRMTSARRGKMDNVLSPDYISNLPDVILAEILERLSIRDAVRTTVLSSKWVDKWMIVQQLIFDENYCKPTSGKVVLTDKFAGIVDNILTQHKGEISKFKLSVLNDTEESGRNIRRWVVLLAKKNIQDLTIEACYYSVCCDSFNACEKLRVLKLSGGMLEVPASNNEFKNLKELWLERICMIEKDLNKLLSKCPLLEKLSLVNILVDLLEIDVKTVKHLHIQAYGDFRIINAKSVTNFSIHHIVDSRTDTDSSKLSAIFARLPEVEKVEVAFYCLQLLALGGVPVKLPIMLNKLRDLSLVINFGDIDAISAALTLFRSAPNLERLKISAWSEALVLSRPANIFSRKEHENVCLKHLKGLILEQANCTRSEVEFIRYLRDNSPELEKFTFNVRGNRYNGEYRRVQQSLTPHNRSMIEVLKGRH